MNSQEVLKILKNFQELFKAMMKILEKCLKTDIFNQEFLINSMFFKKPRILGGENSVNIYKVCIVTEYLQSEMRT